MIDIRECSFKSIPKNGKRLIWEITHTCKMGCDYCFQEKKRKQNPTRTLNENDLTAICKKLPELDIFDVLITGGEIYYIRDVLDKVCGILKDNKITISFSTAQFPRKEFINKLFSYQPRAINISFDPQNLNNVSHYKKELSAINNLLKLADQNNVDVKLTGIIHKNNNHKFNDYLVDIQELLTNYKSLSSVYLTNPHEIGYMKPNIRIDSQQQFDLINTVNELNLEKIKLTNFPTFKENLQKCNAAKYYIHMEPSGNIYPCHLIANFSNSNYYLMGNILNDESETIKENLNSFSKQIDEAIKDYKRINENCIKCNHFSNCGGGCIAEIISAGNMIEPQLLCKNSPHPEKKFHNITFNKEIFDLKEASREITKDEEKKIKEYVLKNIRKNQHDIAHGFDHIKCVVNLARYIAEKENANNRIVTAAAFFHDFAPRRRLIYEGHTKISANEAVSFLRTIGFTEIELKKIYDCIDTSSYYSHELGLSPLSIEAKVVRDADWLDAIGARGIGRVFAFASANNCETLGEVEWDIDNPPKKQSSLIGPDPTPIYHFFSKLLWIKENMCTNTGKELAIRRHQILIDFLKEYKFEMEMTIPDHVLHSDIITHQLKLNLF